LLIPLLGYASEPSDNNATEDRQLQLLAKEKHFLPDGSPVFPANKLPGIGEFLKPGNHPVLES
jgi:hypothetical protein